MELSRAAERQGGGGPRAGGGEALEGTVVVRGGVAGSEPCGRSGPWRRGDSKLTNRTTWLGCSDGADPPILDHRSRSNYKVAGQAANSSRELDELKVS